MQKCAGEKSISPARGRRSIASSREHWPLIGHWSWHARLYV